MSDLHRRMVLLGAAAGLALPFIARPALAQNMPMTFAGRGPITRGEAATITRIPTAQPLVAMTFDDGPHPSLTPKSLEMI